MVKDWGYRAIFKRKDLPSLQEMVKQINQTHNTDMIEDINKRLETNAAATTLSNGIEIQSVTKTEDLVVNVGLRQCIDIILGISSTRFTHMAMANAGGTGPAVTDTDLGAMAEKRNALLPNGWIEPVGMKLFFGSIVPELIDNGAQSIAQMGVYTAASGGILLNREQFNDNQVVRTFTTTNDNYFVYDMVAILSCVVEFCPVAD